MRGLVQTLFEDQVRASAGKAGLTGMIVGVAFNALLRRSPIGAFALGAGLLVYQLIENEREGRTARKLAQAGDAAARADERARSGSRPSAVPA